MTTHQFIIKCPRDWSQQNLQISEQEDMVCYFQPYLPGIVINHVIRKNRPKKPYCLWEVGIMYFHTSATGAYKAIKQYADTYKPRNCNIHNCTVNGSNQYSIEYRVSCVHPSLDFLLSNKTEQRPLQKKIRITLMIAPSGEKLTLKVNTNLTFSQLIADKLGWALTEHEITIENIKVNLADKLVDYKVAEKPFIVNVKRLLGN